MGCVSSKLEDAKLVALCRKRRDLIRDAVHHRYALASSHAAYFRSLCAIGDALERFVEEDLSFATSSSPSVDSSPVLTIPSSEGKVGTTRSKAGGSTPGSSFSHLHEQDEDSHLHFSSDEDDVDEDHGGGMPGIYKSYSPPTRFEGVGNSNVYYYSNNNNNNHNNGSINMNYMRHSSETPNTVYQNPYPTQYETYGHGDEGGGGYFGGASSSNANGGWYPTYNNYYNYPPPPAIPAPTASPPPTPPPPPPGGSSWDFLDPFRTYEQVYSSYPIGSFRSSANSSEVREKEGIPDLEDETEHNAVNEPDIGKTDGSRISVGKATSSSQDKCVLEESMENERHSIGSSPGCIESGSSDDGCILKGDGEDDEVVKKRGVTFEIDTSLETEKSEPNIATALSTQGARDVREVIKEIQEQFIEASAFGEDVSVLLEVGKMRHRTRKTIFRVLSYRILDNLSMKASRGESHQTFKHPRVSAARKVKTRHRDYNRSGNMKFNGLSATLDKLYVWEKKLFREVKDEEKLRISYDKNFKKLKFLKDRGADSHKIEATLVSMHNLMTKIDITIKSIEVISSNVQKLRDEELRPQLTELIQRWKKMWNCLFNCHRKQYLAITDSKTRNILAKIGSQNNYVSKASKQLEMELLNWSFCFSDWINTQKNYLGSLNEWLLNCLNVEPEVTTDGEMPFSPGRIGAPAIFITCNDWHQALNVISEHEVENNMSDFILKLHTLWEIQDKERQQKQKCEFLTHDLARKLNTWYKENEMHRQIDDFPDTKSTVVSENGVPPLAKQQHTLPLDSERKKLEDEKEKHREMEKNVHVEAAKTLRMGLIPVFESLGSFAVGMLKAYDELRIPNSDGLTT